MPSIHIITIRVIRVREYKRATENTALNSILPPSGEETSHLLYLEL